MIESFPSAAEAADVAAAQIVAQLQHALSAGRRASFVATGGRSPGPVYDRLSATRIDWTRITVTVSDERCVTTDAPESNAGPVRQRLLRGPAAAAGFLPLWPAPDSEALAVLQPFDVVMLGMGEDGHIASLIPGDPGLEDALTTADLIRPVPAGLGKPPVARITLTLSALANARAIFLLISGETKRQVIQRALTGGNLPVARLFSKTKATVRILWSPEA